MRPLPISFSCLTVSRCVSEPFQHKWGRDEGPKDYKGGEGDDGQKKKKKEKLVVSTDQSDTGIQSLDDDDDEDE